MYKVRLATPEDFHAILPMAEKFYNSTSFASKIPFDVPSILEYYIHMLQQGFVVVAEDEEGLVGMLGATVHPFHLNVNHIVCTESMWWMEPEHREAGVAGQMMDMLERMAKTAGSTSVIVAKLDTSPPGLEHYYEARGYRAIESSYVKEL